MLSNDPYYTVKNFINILEKYDKESGFIYNRAIKKDIVKIVNMIKKHDEYTFRHSLNVARFSALLARKIGLPSHEVFQISIGALLHDIGKIKINPSILNKPEKLTDIEWKLIKKHPEEGVKILTDYRWTEPLTPTILYHHERMDGYGYFGLKGESIPISARIIHIADAFDAMFFGRPYRKKMTLKQCLKELEVNKGSQFDKNLITPFSTVVINTFSQK